MARYALEILWRGYRKIFEVCLDIKVNSLKQVNIFKGSAYCQREPKMFGFVH